MERVTDPEKAAVLTKPLISWGAVLGGWVFAYGVAMLLYLLGGAIGITTLEALNQIHLGVAITTGVWMFITWVASLFVGGLFAGRLSGRGDGGSGAMHGMIVWAFAGIVTIFMGLAQLGALAPVGAAVGAEMLEPGVAAEIPGEMQQIPEGAAEFTAGALWFLFISSLAGLIAASWGGILGARRTGKLYVSTGLYGRPSLQPEERAERRRPEEGEERRAV